MPFNHYLTSPLEAAIKAGVELSAKAAKSKEGGLESFSAMVNYLIKRFATDDDITTVDADF